MLSANHSLAYSVPGDGQQAAADICTPAQSDALLQASRRIDWRFLLPDPNLGRVVYFGQSRAALVESLRLFSARLTVIDAASMRDGPPAPTDIVVVSAPSYAMLEQAAKWVRPEGFLYVEAYWLFRSRLRGWSRGITPRLMFPADYISAVEGLGFVEAEANWHWPNFESCAEIVPLGDPISLAHALGRRRSGGAARLKSAFGRALMRIGLFAYIVPCFSIVARRRVTGKSE